MMNVKLPRIIPCLLFATISTVSFASAGSSGKAIVVTSPDRTVRAELSLQSGSLTYRITVDGTEVLAPSQLGILSDGVELGQSVILGNPTRRSVNEQYPFFGAHSVAVNQANEATVPVTSHGKSYLVDVHVANDGVGVRMRLPAERGRRIQADRSTWMLKGDPTMWVDKLDPGYESPYRTTSLRQLGSEALGLPITAQVGKYYITITEAILKDFGDLGVRPSPNGALEGELFADPQGWTTDQPVIQPWRVTVIARDLTSLVNTTLVQNLNPPPNSELVGADWIKPGRSSWQWLAIGAPHQEDQEQWVDWTRQLGFQYYLIDEGWSSWKDAWASVASVVSYAKARNIKIWIWVDSKEVETADARRAYFQKVVDAGVAGVKIDFPPPTNHWWSTWYFDTARDAADFHLMLDFHGASKPTGMERTWPNVLTREAVRGHEYQITRYGRRLDAFHDVILPFTRYIAGPADYTPTVFNPKELQGNTWGHELAQAIIFTSPLLCFGGHPKAYLENPALDVIRAIPSVWDETRVLPGSQPGKLVAEARRSGNTWFIAVINGGEPLSLNLSLDFLGKGTWNATELFDANDKPDAWNRKIAKVAGSDHIALSLSPRGGFVARIRPE